MDKMKSLIDLTIDFKGLVNLLINFRLSVWSNGLLLEYVDGDQKTETAFHPISSLHYCAAVRYVNVTGYAIEGGGERFLPLDSPFANNDDSSQHPPIFAAIFRRTTGIKVSFKDSRKTIISLTKNKKFKFSLWKHFNIGN